MKKIKVQGQYILPVMMLFAVTFARAQTLTPQVISPGGSYAAGGGYSLSQNLGELAVQTFSGGSNILTQGFEQPYPEVVLNINDPKDAGMAITLYPNPAFNQVFVKIRSEKSMDYLFKITNLLGQEISSAVYSSSPAGTVYAINVSNMASGLYFLAITSTDQKFSQTVPFNKN